MVRSICILSVAICARLVAGAQPGCFAQIVLDKRSVYVQEPFKVTITVLTATWFTAPLDLDNIRIPGAFILPFEKTTPGMFTVGGRQYAGLQFYFIVFPYQPGTFVLPPLHIVAHTPPAGSSTSVKVTVATGEQPFTVKPVPASGKEDGWLVAKNVTVSQHWSKSLQRLRVGDVLERTVVVDARGTLPQFIPPLQRDPLSFADSYLQPAQLRDLRNEYDANGRLIQTVIYLLEKEGDFELPAIAISWWNPLTGKDYSREAAGTRVHIADNPDLGMLTTLKDSLKARDPAAGVPAPEGPARLFGLAWYWALLVIAGAAWFLYRSIGWSAAVRRWWLRRRALYLAGERYAFRRLMRVSPQGRPFLRALYGWWDRVAVPGKSSSLTEQMHRQGAGPTEEYLRSFFDEFYGDGNESARAKEELRKGIRRYRKRARLNC